MVIAGGITNHLVPLASTEILSLETRTIEYGKDLNVARRGFHIVAVTMEGIKRVLALGGTSDDSSILDSVEEYDPVTMTWRPLQTRLEERRSSYGLVPLPEDVICQC